ncbi:MAG: hypothetical protein ACI8TF_002314 [Paracoccaceae bacterium]
MVRQLLFGENNALIAAKYLVDGTMIVPWGLCSGVTCSHLLFAEHEIVMSMASKPKACFPVGSLYHRGHLRALQRFIRSFPNLRITHLTMAALRGMVG